MSMQRSAIARNRADVANLLKLSNLMDRLAQATGEEWAEGLAWYDTASGIGETLADDFGLTRDAGCGIIAAISPQLGWDLNVRFARTLCETDDSGSALSLGADRARTIRDNPHCNPLDILGGPKVRSFYRNIAEPWTSGPVTIDRHAIAILAGVDTPKFFTDRPKFLDRSTVYRQATGFYRTAARAYGILPHQAQAVAWVSHRNASFVPSF